MSKSWVSIDFYWLSLIKLINIDFFVKEFFYLFSIKRTIWITNPAFTKLYLLCFMLLQIECLKFVAFPQLFASLPILKCLIVSKQWMNEWMCIYIPHISHIVSRRFTILIEWDWTSACKGASGCRYQLIFREFVIT